MEAAVPSKVDGDCVASLAEAPRGGGMEAETPQTQSSRGGAGRTSVSSMRFSDQEVVASAWPRSGGDLHRRGAETVALSRSFDTQKAREANLVGDSQRRGAEQETSSASCTERLATGGECWLSSKKPTSDNKTASSQEPLGHSVGTSASSTSAVINNDPNIHLSEQRCPYTPSPSSAHPPSASDEARCAASVCTPPASPETSFGCFSSSREIRVPPRTRGDFWKTPPHNRTRSFRGAVSAASDLVHGSGSFRRPRGAECGGGASPESDGSAALRASLGGVSSGPVSASPPQRAREASSEFGWPRSSALSGAGSSAARGGGKNRDLAAAKVGGALGGRRGRDGGGRNRQRWAESSPGRNRREARRLSLFAGSGAWGRDRTNFARDKSEYADSDRCLAFLDTGTGAAGTQAEMETAHAKRQTLVLEGAGGDPREGTRFTPDAAEEGVLGEETRLSRVSRQRMREGGDSSSKRQRTPPSAPLRSSHCAADAGRGVRQGLPLPPPLWNETNGSANRQEEAGGLQRTRHNAAVQSWSVQTAENVQQVPRASQGGISASPVSMAAISVVAEGQCRPVATAASTGPTPPLTSFFPFSTGESQHAQPALLSRTGGTFVLAPQTAHHATARYFAASAAAVSPQPVAPIDTSSFPQTPNGSRSDASGIHYAQSSGGGRGPLLVRIPGDTTQTRVPLSASAEELRMAAPLFYLE